MHSHIFNLFLHETQAQGDSVPTYNQDQAQDDGSNKEKVVPKKHSEALRENNPATEKLVSASETKETKKAATVKIQSAKEKGVEEMHRIASTEEVKFYNLSL